MRLEEGDALSAAGHYLIAIYLYGYVAEMTIKAAYFKNLRYNFLDEIDRDARNRAMALARLHDLMSRDPHDIPGWARLLVWERERLHSNPYSPSVALEIIKRSRTVYEDWRPQMRYRNTVAKPDRVKSVRDAAAWFVNHFSKL